MDKIINGYTYTNRLRTDAYSKAKVKSLIEDFYSNAYDLDAINYPYKKKLLRKLLSLLIPGTPFDAVKKRDELYRSVKKI